MLDRTIAPAAEKIESITIPEFSKRNLKNGVPVYFLNSGNQEVLKIEIILNSGVKYENVAGSSYLVSRLLTAGTTNKSASQIATELDYFGAFTETSSGFDHITISIYCLKKFLAPILALITDLLCNSIFPVEELQTTIRQKLNELSISDRKDSQVAAKKFRQNLFGLEHPYGQVLSAEDLNNISHDDVVDFYNSTFFNAPMVTVCGKVDTEVLDQIGESFEKFPVKNVDPKEGNIIQFNQKQIIDRPESVQSSIRIGCLTINKHHPDIHKLHITTSLLGGYFGSRLMKNIREDKGYTYGIGASIAHLQDASFLVISTDVVKKYTQNTVQEIENEIRILQNEPVDINELETLKNYLSGKFLSGLDTAFNIAGKFKAVKLHGLGYGYYNDFLKTLQEISPEEIQQTAKEYFNLDQMNSVIVGEDI